MTNAGITLRCRRSALRVLDKSLLTAYLSQMLGLLPNHLKKDLADFLVSNAERASGRLGFNGLKDKLTSLKSGAGQLKIVIKATTAGIEAYRNQIQIAAAEDNISLHQDLEPADFSKICELTVLIIENPFTDDPRTQRDLADLLKTVLVADFSGRIPTEAAYTSHISTATSVLMELPSFSQRYSLFLQSQLVDVTRGIHNNTTPQLEGRSASQLQISSDATPGRTSEPKKTLSNLPTRYSTNAYGRETEKEKVLGLLAPYPESKHSIISIEGIGGIGKTTLALSVCYHLAFEDAQHHFGIIVWTSAKTSVLTSRGIISRPNAARSLSEILHTISSALGIDVPSDCEMDKKIRIVYEALASSRSLIVFDNYETVIENSVLSFIHDLPAPTKVLITTRHKVDASYPVRLGGLSVSASREMVEALCQQYALKLDSADVNTLVSLCHGVPLAVHWAASLLSQGLSLKGLKERMGDHSSDISEFCFNEILEGAISTEAVMVLQSAAFFPIGATLSAVGQISSLPPSQVDDAVFELQRVSLAEIVNNRIIVLPLTRKFLLQRIEAMPEASHLYQRWRQYFIDLSPLLDGTQRGSRSYETTLSEGANLLALFDYLLDTEDIDTIASLAASLNHYLDLSGRWADVFLYGAQIQELANQRNAIDLEIWLQVHWFGWILIDQGKLREAQAGAQRSVDYLMTTEDAEGLNSARIHLGRVFRRMAKLDEAQNEYEEAYRTAIKAGFTKQAMAAVNELGKLARDKGLWDEAIEQFMLSEKLLLDLEREGSAAEELLWNEAKAGKAWALHNLGKSDAALTILKQVLQDFEKVEARGYQVSLLYRMAIVEISLGHNDDATEHAQRCKMLAMELGIARELRLVDDLIAKIERDEL